MDRRHAARLIAVLVCAGCTVPARPLAPGAPVQGAPRSGMALVWVVPADEFRTCGPVAAELRRAGASASVPLLVVFVGPHPEWMVEYLRVQRLHPAFAAMSQREFERCFAVAPVHAIYGVRQGRVRSALRVSGGSTPDGAVERFVERATRDATVSGTPRRDAGTLH